MNGANTSCKPARRSVAWPIAFAVAGIAATGFFLSQSYRLQTKLGETSGKLEQTQTQLEDAAKELQQTQDELARVRAALNASQQQLVQASNQIAEVRGELETAQSQVSQMVPGAAETREMPLMFGFRRAASGSGYILWFQSKTTKTLPLKVTITDAAGKKLKPAPLELAGAAISGTGFLAAPVKEISEAGGRAFASGDQIEVTCAGFDPIRKTLP